MLRVTCFCLALVPTVALADVPPPDICNDPGAACETPQGGDGVCTPSTCTRLDYSMRAENGVPGSVEYECNRCIAAPASASGCSCRAVGGSSAGGWIALLPFGLLIARRLRS